MCPEYLTLQDVVAQHGTYITMYPSWENIRWAEGIKQIGERAGVEVSVVGFVATNAPAELRITIGGEHADPR